MNRRSLLLILWAIQGLIALLWLALLPTDAGRGALLGFSGARLALIGLMLALTAWCGAAGWLWRDREWSLPGGLRDLLAGAALIALLAAPGGIIILGALGRTSGFTYAAYAARLAPPAFWLALAAAELFAVLMWQERREIAARLDGLRPLVAPAARILAILAGIALLVGITRLGVTPSQDAGSWGNPATPLLEWQILLALVAGLAFMIFGQSLPRRERWIVLLVYAATAALWLSQPVIPGFFATAPRAPNFEIYPFSDAQIYAQYAQTALTGHGFAWPDVPARPLYIAFLTWLHAIGGQEYTHVIALQTLVLAAFPAALYLLGKELGGRPLGVGLALLAALRDVTANQAAPFALNYTYSKLFFSEIPAALLLCVFTLMALRWMRGGRRGWYPLVAGGVLGLAALIRLQSAVVLAAVIPLGFIVMRGQRRAWAAGSALLVAGTLLALLPWIARNYLATGGLVLDNPISQGMVLAQRWNNEKGFEHVQSLAGEGEAQYAGRMMGLALAGFAREPGGILGAAAQHFLNNEIGNLLVFPLRDRLDGPGELIWPQHAFWQGRDGRPGAGQMALIAVYLCLLGLGVAAAWFKLGPAGLLPLGISLAYNAWTGLFLSSGDRFLVPVDWGVYVYHFMGLLTLAALALSGLRSARGRVAGWLLERGGNRATGEDEAASMGRGLALAAIAIVLAGACVPLTETVFPQLQPPSRLVLEARPGEVLLSGRAIYPRYYAAGEGEPGTAKNGYGKSAQARLVFWLSGARSTLVILPLEKAPSFFPNTADVMLNGTEKNGFIEAHDILVVKDGRGEEYGR